MVRLEIPTRLVILILFMPLVLWITYWALTALWPVILLVLISLVLVLGLLPYVDGMVRLGIPRIGAVLLLLFGFLFALIAMFSIMVPAIVEEVDSIRENLPDTAREVEELLDGFGIEVELQERATEIDWNQLISGRAAIDYTQRVMTIIVSFVAVVAITAYLLADTPRMGAFLKQFIPPSRLPEAEKLFRALTRVVGGYLRGQAITSLAIGVFTFVVLRVVGVPNALAYAVLAAFADIIPIVGAIIATVPPVLAALQESSTQALIVLGALMLYQQFEDRYFAPRVYGTTLNLPPVIVLIAVLAGAELMGIVGVLLALPLTAAGRVGLDYALQNQRWLVTADQHEQPFAPDMPPAETEQSEQPVPEQGQG